MPIIKHIFKKKISIAYSYFGSLLPKIKKTNQSEMAFLLGRLPESETNGELFWPLTVLSSCWPKLYQNHTKVKKLVICSKCYQEKRALRQIHSLVKEAAAFQIWHQI